YRQYHADAYFAPQRLFTGGAKRWLRIEHPFWERLLLRQTTPSFAAGIRRSHLYLSVEEVGSLWHLPQGIDLLDISWISARQERSFLVPYALTREPGWKIGVSRHAGQSADVLFPTEELTRHMLLVGRTGKGKSTLFEHLALAHQVLGRGGLC